MMASWMARLLYFGIYWDMMLDHSIASELHCLGFGPVASDAVGCVGANVARERRMEGSLRVKGPKW